eukprot:GHVN01002000.1.p1 GENE.GHVN01002000.1~~GHVN01002000.1.p1  ORF type:complete len:1111 (+),score=137.06 GHVN01002000.1:49-3381(+)
MGDSLSWSDLTIPQLKRLLVDNEIDVNVSLLKKKPEVVEACAAHLAIKHCYLALYEAGKIDSVRLDSLLEFDGQEQKERRSIVPTPYLESARSTSGDSGKRPPSKDAAFAKQSIRVSSRGRRQGASSVETVKSSVKVSTETQRFETPDADTSSQPSLSVKSATSSQPPPSRTTRSTRASANRETLTTSTPTNVYSVDATARRSAITRTNSSSKNEAENLNTGNEKYLRNFDAPVQKRTGRATLPTPTEEDVTAQTPKESSKQPEGRASVISLPDSDEEPEPTKETIPMPAPAPENKATPSHPRTPDSFFTEKAMPNQTDKTIPLVGPSPIRPAANDMGTTLNRTAEEPPPPASTSKPADGGPQSSNLVRTQLSSPSGQTQIPSQSRRSFSREFGGRPLTSLPLDPHGRPIKLWRVDDEVVEPPPRSSLRNFDAPISSAKEIKEKEKRRNTQRSRANPYGSSRGSSRGRESDGSPHRSDDEEPCGSLVRSESQRRGRSPAERFKPTRPSFASLSDLGKVTPRGDSAQCEIESEGEYSFTDEGEDLDNEESDEIVFADEETPGTETRTSLNHARYPNPIQDPGMRERSAQNVRRHPQEPPSSGSMNDGAGHHESLSTIHAENRADALSSFLGATLWYAMLGGLLGLSVAFMFGITSVTDLLPDPNIYCDTSSHTVTFSGQTTNEGDTGIECTPCPSFAECSDGRLTICAATHLVEWDSTARRTSCIRNDAIHQQARSYFDSVNSFLRSLEGVRQCEDRDSTIHDGQEATGSLTLLGSSTIPRFAVTAGELQSYLRNIVDPSSSDQQFAGAWQVLMDSYLENEEVFSATGIRKKKIPASAVGGSTIPGFSSLCEGNETMIGKVAVYDHSVGDKPLSCRVRDFMQRYVFLIFAAATLSVWVLLLFYRQRRDREAVIAVYRLICEGTNIADSGPRRGLAIGPRVLEIRQSIEQRDDLRWLQSYLDEQKISEIAEELCRTNSMVIRSVLFSNGDMEPFFVSKREVDFIRQKLYETPTRSHTAEIGRESLLSLGQEQCGTPEKDDRGNGRMTQGAYSTSWPRTSLPKIGVAETSPGVPRGETSQTDFSVSHEPPYVSGVSKIDVATLQAAEIHPTYI